MGPGADGFVAPAYGARSLADVVPAVAAALGVGDVLGAPGGPVDGVPGLLLPDAPSYVMLLVDGLGAELLARHAHAAPYLSSLVAGGATGTAGVPSTTATSLTSLGTALPPGAHGLVGYTSRVPGTDTLLNALQWDRDLDPLVWQPHPTAFDRLVRAGVDVVVVGRREFAASGLTRAAHRGARYVGADTVAERVSGALAATMAAGGVVPSLTYLYEGDLDKTGHLHGVASSEWLRALAQVDEEAEQLREALPPSTRLLVVADHGMVDSSGAGRLDVDEVPALRDGLVLLGGEARFRHLWPRAGALDDVLATWRAVLGDRADVLTREDAEARGWFGPVAASVAPRMGDLVVACRGDLVLLSSRDFAVETRLVGFHGSLTPDEMLVPVLVG